MKYMMWIKNNYLTHIAEIIIRVNCAMEANVAANMIGVAYDVAN